MTQCVTDGSVVELHRCDDCASRVELWVCAEQAAVVCGDVPCSVPGVDYVPYLCEVVPDGVRVGIEL